MSAARRQKIVILGGGVGAMSAAFALTDQPGWDDLYEVDVYQLGWRLGGKGASGRNLRAHGRIEEHGLHIWLGFYDNAFRMIQKCYHELGRPAGTPLATWTEAFTPQDYVVFDEHVDGHWHRWPVTYPRNKYVPGQGATIVHPWECVELGLKWILQVLADAGHDTRERERAAALAMVAKRTRLIVTKRGPRWWERVAREAIASVRDVGLVGLGVLLQTALWMTRALGPRPERHPPGAHRSIGRVVEAFLQRLWMRCRDQIEKDAATRHLWINVDLMATIIVGMLADQVPIYGFDSINHLDLADWLAKHHASDRLSIHSAWVRSGYDLVFGFRQGNGASPSLAAGVGLRGFLRMALTYKGAVAWRMHAGMGDVVFAPLYQVLRQRGVRFHFFHRARALHLSGDRQSIDTIDLGRQATPKNGDYDPLITVGGLPCWPSEPRYDQLVEGDELERRAVNLESSWIDWPEDPVTLRKGRDFDQIVLGVSIGALPSVCQELIDASAAWSKMVERVKTVRTQAFQLWSNWTLAELGWITSHGSSGPILTTFVEPVDTWADMTALIPREEWPSDGAPRQISYFCGALADPDEPEPPYFTDPEYPRRQTERVRLSAQAFLEKQAHYLWPHVVNRETDALHWEFLLDEADRAGPDRLHSQYFRANVEPSERYVLSLPGSIRHRLKSDRSGFANLFLAGDWTFTGINAGCVEAAVMSGLRAARGISGFPQKIAGEPDD